MRGVAPVLAVALLIGIVVVLTRGIGVIVINEEFGDPPEPSARLAFKQQMNGSSVTVTAYHHGGDPLTAAHTSVVVIDHSGDGNDNGAFSETLSAGDNQVITSTVESGDEIRVVWNPPDDPTSKLIAEYTVE